MRHRQLQVVIASSLAVAGLAGCTARTSSEAPVTVTATSTLTASAAPLRLGLTLPGVVATSEFGSELEAFLNSGLEDFGGVAAPTADDPCRIVVGVYGADLEHGALDFEVGSPGDDKCGGDSIATFRRIRDFAAVAEATTCLDCGEGFSDGNYQQLTSVYGNREPVYFTYNTDDALVPFDQATD